MLNVQVSVFSSHPLLCLQRAPHSFQPQMKLEAVDKRSPGLIRVATVEEVDTHRIKVILCVRSACIPEHLKRLGLMKVMILYVFDIVSQAPSGPLQL